MTRKTVVQTEQPSALPNRPDSEEARALSELLASEAHHEVDLDLVRSISERAFAHTMAMIHVANYEREKRPGDPKVGGHPASCASSVHFMGALHLVVREPHDYVCCKPHASPVDHSYHHLMRFFKTGAGQWLNETDAKLAMHHLRDFPRDPSNSNDPTDQVFQSYHARTDPDSFHFLPSGSVGIPQVASVYLALAHRYAKDHGWTVPQNTHFWSMMGDSEFREGSVLEAMPDVAERRLGNVTWIVDYNRQNLDGTRMPNERGLHGSDAERIEETAVANGWDVIQVRHGKFREEVFERPGGERLRLLFEGGMSDYELQMLLLSGDGNEMRKLCLEKDGQVAQALDTLADEQLVRLFNDLGGHDMERMVEALQRSKLKDYRPCLIIAHTLKGWGLECAADPANHSALPSKKEIAAILESRGLSIDDPFALFPEDSPEGRFLKRRGDSFRLAVAAHERLRAENRDWIRNAIRRDGDIPRELTIDLSMFPRVHTQWMWGQLATKLVRIGTADEGGPQTASSAKGDLTEKEQRWKTAADFLLTLSPDVGTSTNISPLIDQRVYGPGDQTAAFEEELEVAYKHPVLTNKSDAWTRHIRFEIAEANCMSAVGAFGKMAHYTGLPFFPIMTVYDFFIKRALDQLFYNLYWGAEFVILGTPSGVNLSSEGAQHSWKSDIQIPNLITWEPMFALELDWILSDAIKRHMEDTNEGRRGVLIRCVTRAISQKLMMENLRRHANCKQAGSWSGPLKPKQAGQEWGADAIDESSVPAQLDEELLGRVRDMCLEGGYYIVDWRGYAGYEPGDNVVHVFSMGSVTTEAIEASEQLLERGIFANVICVTSPELLLGILGEQSNYRHLREGLGVDGDLHAVPAAPGNTASPASEAQLISIAGRRVPCVALCDGEAGLLDNIGSIVGVKQRTLAVRKFAKCGRPDQAFEYQHLDCDSIVEACGRVLSETALERLDVSPTMLERLLGRNQAARPDWRELWPDVPDA